MKVLDFIRKLKSNMKVLGFIKEGEHIVVCDCGAIIKYSDKDIISENVCEVDYWGVDRSTEHSIICKSCNRKIQFR